MVLRRFTGLLLVAAFVASAPAGAVNEPTRSSVADASVVQIDEPRYLGVRLNGETGLADAAGRPFKLAEMMGKPLILLLSYYGCDGTCPVMNAELAKVLEKVDRFTLGKDYRVLTVSFDKRDTVDTARDFLAKSAGVPLAMRDGWRHAVLRTVTPEEFAKGIGFRFFWSEAAKAFMHPNVIVFVTPEGRVARYIYGTRLDAKTVELALLEADWERISNSTSVFDMATGACFSFNYAEGRYQVNYSLLAGVGSLALGIASMLLGAWVFRRKLARKARGERYA